MFTNKLHLSLEGVKFVRYSCGVGGKKIRCLSFCETSLSDVFDASLAKCALVEHPVNCFHVASF